MLSKFMEDGLGIVAPLGGHTYLSIYSSADHIDRAHKNCDAKLDRIN